MYLKSNRFSVHFHNTVLPFVHSSETKSTVRRLRIKGQKERRNWVKNCFFGKYFKCENESSSIAFIPAMHRSGGRECASLQIIRDGGALSLSFDRLQRDSDGTLRLGGCRFSDSGFGATLWGLSSMYRLCNAGTAYTACGTELTASFT